MEKSLALIKEARYIPMIFTSEPFRKSALEKDYEQAAKSYELAIQILFKSIILPAQTHPNINRLAKGYKNDQQKESVKKVIEKMLNEFEKILELKKDAEKQQVY